MKSISVVSAAGFLTLVVLACERPAPQTVERIPTVKTIAVRPEAPTTDRVASPPLFPSHEERDEE